jgi:DNA-directed RNA polymerase subunit H
VAKFDVMSHKLVPTHILLSDADAQKVLTDHQIRKEQLPKIYLRDPCVKAVGAKVGDIIKIVRESHTAGQSVAFRLVIDI